MTETLHNDPLVISVRLNRYDVRQLLMDKSTSVNLLTLKIFNKLGLDKINLTTVSYSLVGLREKILAVLGTINLPLVLGDEKHKREVYVEFAVVDILVAYNVILGRLVLNCYEIVIDMDVFCLMLPTPRGLAIV